MTDEEPPPAPPAPDPLAPWPTLAERESGLLPPPEYFEDVPPHLNWPLRAWVDTVIGKQPGLARRVTTRLRASSTVVTHSGAPATNIQIVQWLAAGETGYCDLPRPVDRLTVIDAIVALHPDWQPDVAEMGPNQAEAFQKRWIDQLVSLHELLTDSGSAWQVDPELPGLCRRVDAPVVEAWQRARASAEQASRPSAARFLTEAWRLIYGMHPQPSAGYAAAVKAVEAVALPVVSPGKPKATVHQARTELQKHGDQWRFVLGEADDVPEGHGSIEVVATMLDRLLRGETDRHANENVNRPSTAAEAQAAVHLAAVLVQWFVSGAIQPRTASGGSEATSA